MPNLIKFCILELVESLDFMNLMRIAYGDPMPNQTGLKPGAHSYEKAKVDPMPYVGIRPGSQWLSKV